MPDLLLLVPLSADPLSPLSPDVYSDKIKHLLEPAQDPVPPTQHQERLLTRGPHQDAGSDDQPGDHSYPCRVQYSPTGYHLQQFRRCPFPWLSIALKTTGDSFISPLATCAVLGRLSEAFFQTITLSRQSCIWRKGKERFRENK